MATNNVWNTEAGHRAQHIAIYTRRDVNKTKNNSRRKEHKARGTSYCNASDYTELRTAPSRADMAYPYGIPLSTHSCKWCTIYHIELCKYRD